MTLDSDAKFEDKLTFRLKNGMRKLAYLHRAHESLKIGTFIGYFYPK